MLDVFYCLRPVEIPNMADAQTSESKRKRNDDESQSDQAIDEDINQLKILPRDQWKTDSNYRLLCKISGCMTRGRSEKDDMCKRHYTMFKAAGVGTGGRRVKKKVARKKK